MSNFARMAAAAVAVIAVVAFGLAVFSGGRTPSPGAGPSASPSQSPSPSAPPSASLPPSPIATPVEGVAAEFRHPFAYTLPAGTGWNLLPIESDALAEFWIPNSGPFGSAVGVIVRAIDGGRVDPCAASSDPLPLPGGPEAVIDYIKTLPGVEVTGESSTTIDGMPAVQAFVEAGPATPECSDLKPFAKQDRVQEDEAITQVGPGVGVRVTTFDLGGDHIVMWTWADTPEWFDVADRLIDSFRF